MRDLVTSLVGNIRALTMEDPAQPLQPYSVLMDMLGMTITDAGMMVNEKTAIRQPSVLACVRVISQELSSLPLEIFERIPRGKRRAADHRLYPVLHDSPNPQMTSMAWREGCEAQRQLWGNAYTEIQRDGAGRAVALWPLPSDRTNPERLNGVLRYVTTATPGGERRFIQAKDVLHVPLMAFDGITGVSPVQLIKQTIGRAMAMERFGAQFFGNGARPSGMFVYKGGTMDKEAKDNLRQTFQSAVGGMNNLRPFLAEGDFDWKPFTIPNNEAQFTEAMKEIVADIARGWGVPLHLIQELSRATNNNIEQQALEFIMYCLRPHGIKWEQELNRKLFAGTPYFVEHSMEGLLRGDFKTRMEGYQALFQVGGLSPNMVAELENWNPIPDEEGGDLRFVPMNMIPLEGVQKALDAPPDDKQDQEETSGDDGTPSDPSDPNAALRRERVLNACRPLFRDAVNRTISRARRDQETCARIWRPVMESAGEMTALCLLGADGIPDDARHFAATYAGDLWQRAADWSGDFAPDILERELDAAYAALLARLKGSKASS